MKDTIIEIVKTLISTGRTKFLAALGAIGAIVYLIKQQFITGDLPVIIIGLVAIAYFVADFFHHKGGTDG